MFTITCDANHDLNKILHVQLSIQPNNLYRHRVMITSTFHTFPNRGLDFLLSPLKKKEFENFFPATNFR